MEVYVSQFVLFLMLFIRITALIVTAPVVGHQAVPVQTKIAIGLFFSLVMMPMNAAMASTIDINLMALVVLALKEAMVGVLIGFTTSLFFHGIRYAGELISFDMGLSLANVYDPESGQNTPVIGEFLYLITLLIFLMINGHHFVFEALQLSYHTVPIGRLEVDGALSQTLIHEMSMLFVVAIKCAAPVMVSVFLTNLVLAVLSRVMPQMNVFSVSFPLKIIVGLLVLMVTAPLMAVVFKNMLKDFQADVMELVRVL